MTELAPSDGAPGRSGDGPPASRPGPRRWRRTARILHLVAGAVLGAFVYAPSSVTEPLRPVLQVAVLPGSAITGLLLWRLAAVRRTVGRLRRAPTTRR